MARNLPLDVEYRQGIHVQGSVLWLDAPRKTDVCFVSHAHVDPVGPHRKFLSSPATAALLRRRIGHGRFLISPFHRRFSLGELDLELHPAGHMLGSAQIRITRAGVRLVYTADFRLGRSRTAEEATVLSCDLLVMNAVYGLPHQIFPKREEVEAEMVDWARGVIGRGEQPVFFASPIGKAQELASLFVAHGLPVRVHRSIYRLCRIYRELGIGLPDVRCLRQSPPRGEVLIYPPGLQTSKTLAGLKQVRTCMASGRPANSTDAWFAWSGHADHPALVRYARESGATKIYVTGPAAVPLAAELRTAGLDASPLQPTEQMKLF